MSMINRIFTVIRGVFDKRVRDLEWRHPEAVYENAIQQRQSQYQRAAEALAGVIASEKRQKKGLADNLKKLEQVEKALEYAIIHEDRQRGPQLTKLRRELQSGIDSDQQNLLETSRSINEWQGSLGQIKKDIERLKTEKVDAIAKIRMLQARHDVDALESFGVAQEDKALTGLRERVEQQEIKQDVLRSTKVNHAVIDEAISDAEFDELCRRNSSKQDGRNGMQHLMPAHSSIMALEQANDGVYVHASRA